MFSVKDKRRIDALNEHKRTVNKAWKSGSQMDDYHLPDEYKYLGGSQGGIESKPSAHIIAKVTYGYSIVDLFLEYVSITDAFEPIKFLFNRFVIFRHWLHHCLHLKIK